MEKLISPVIKNQKRIELVYQAVISLEAQTWGMRHSPNPLESAINFLEVVEEAIYKKYPIDAGFEQGDDNDR
ncbi:hypothetical protein [Polynucleobacter sp. JS-JIR-II-b4]|uniref:hypothetical protein n=1 Tax=Polynucleobacter sp. JS-JIR-II-b4 TaxID=1758390 RepID=UPI001BFCF30C|nr:hypothetical protein [Polynucleobacter sp. JS-JIR-II-b4]QWE02304.1 hypothetical protein ICV90_09005 [Polynucleobacter sp. JS-JIR-II-b4]